MAKKKATKQHGTDKTFLDRETGTYFMTAAVHQGRVTRVYQGPKQIDAEGARAAFNDGLYRNIEVSNETPDQA